MSQRYAAGQGSGSRILLREIYAATAEERQAMLESAIMHNEEGTRQFFDKVMAIDIDLTCDYIEKVVHAKIKNRNKIDALKLYWNEDEINIDERIAAIFKEYNKSNNIEWMCRRLNLLTDTEMNNIMCTLIWEIADMGGFEVVYRLEVSEGTCELCQGYSDVAIDMDEFDSDKLPPFHPGCMCTIDIVEEEVEADVVEIDADTINDRDHD